MRTEAVDPRYGLNPDEAYWVYGDSEVTAMLEALDSGKIAEAKRMLIERRYALGWQSNK
ncbi:MAG: hypothetical protein O3B73_07525 [bacterium]|nr:hypothetical protein [bacterium]